MSTPRCHLPGQVAHITRRCTERRFLLRPDGCINAILPFELARSNSRGDVEIHGFVAMSNHVHMVVSDLTGDRSDVMRDFLSGVGKARGAELGRSGVWEPKGPYDDTVIGTQPSLEQQLLYVWLNPVAAGLVPRAKDWPGFKILPADWGKTVRVEIPDAKFYAQNGRVFEFTPMPPPGYEHMSLPEVIAYFEDKLRKAENEVIAQRRQVGRGFKGVEWVRKQSPHRRAGSRTRFRKLSPRFAGKDPEWKAMAIAAYYEFLNEYRRCRLLWMAGDHEVVFPAGTLQMRHRSPAKVRGPTGDEPSVLRRAA